MADPRPPKTPAKSNKKVGNGIVALSSAAVLTVYAAGYARTRAAAERLEAFSQRRPELPGPREAGGSEAASEPQRGANPFATPVPQAQVAPVDSSATATPSVAASPATPAAGAPAVSPTTASSPAVASGAETPAAHADVPASVTTKVDGSDAVTAPLPPAVPIPPVAVVAKVETPAAPLPVAPVPAAPASNANAQSMERPPATPAPAPAAPKGPAWAGPWKDGRYLGWGYSRHGDIQAQVVIANGRIDYAVIAKCLTRYSCSIIEHLQKQVGQRQSPEVDYVAAATESANAFYGAIVEALKSAK